MVLNGIVNIGRNDHKAATQDVFRPLIMAFRLHGGKFAFCKDQSEFGNTYDCWDFSGQDEVTRGHQVGSVENLVGLEDIFGFYETWLG